MDTIAANGIADNDEDSWLNKLYSNLAETKKEVDAEDDGEEFDEIFEDEDLESPILVNDNNEHKIAKRASGKLAGEKAVVADIYRGEGSCQKKLWKCLSHVVEDGLHHTEEPGGIKKYVLEFSCFRRWL